MDRGKQRSVASLANRMMRATPGVRVRQGFAVESPGPAAVRDPRSIPIVINNFNRLVCLRELLAALRSRGYENTYVIDNDSTYEPLLEFYEDSGLRVFRLDTNVGGLALWTTPVGEHFVNGHYAYTDSDVVPAAECPDDFMARFLDVLARYPQALKAGFGLEIDDLPPAFEFRDKVVAHERHLLTDLAEPGLYRAPIDTTFALYRPGAAGGFWLPGMRTTSPYLARHLPWYADSSRPDEEELFYRRTMRTSTHWSLLGDEQRPGTTSVMLWDVGLRVADDARAGELNRVWRPEWEPETLDAIDWLLDPGRTYLELGSGIGHTALCAARLAGTVYALEGDAGKYALLAENVALNRAAAHNVVALGLRLSGRAPGRGRVTFAEFAGAHPLRDCSLVKMDIGGDEYGLLPAMVPFLRRVRPSLHLTLRPRRFFRIKGPSLPARAAASVTSLLSTLYLLWLLRFYRHVYDAFGDEVRPRDLPGLCRGELTLILTDKARTPEPAAGAAARVVQRGATSSGSSSLDA